VEALIAQTDELLADVSTPEQPAPEAEGGEEKNAANPSGDTATEAVTYMMKETESVVVCAELATRLADEFLFLSAFCSHEPDSRASQ